MEIFHDLFSAALFYIIVTCEVPLLIRIGCSPCHQLHCSLSMWQLTCAHEEWSAPCHQILCACPIDNWGPLLRRNGGVPYQLLCGVFWWELRAKGSWEIRCSLSCCQLLCCVLVTAEVPVFIRNVDATCPQLFCPVSIWQLRDLCSCRMEMLPVLSSATLWYFFVTPEGPVFMRNGDAPCLQWFCAVPGWQLRVMCSLWMEMLPLWSSAPLFYVHVTGEDPVCMGKAGTLCPQLLCAMSQRYLRAMCKWQLVCSLPCPQLLGAMSWW